MAALLEKAGFETVLSEQIQKDAWYKLWGNMTVNPVSAMTGATTDLILNDDLVRGFISAVMLEAREIGGRIGIPIEQQPEDRHLVTRKLGAFKTSMLQDVEAGKPVEIDALVTVVKELGELTGVPTPFTDALLGLSRLHARARPVLTQRMAAIPAPARAISGAAFATLLLIALMMGANHVAARIAFNNGVDVATAVVFRSSLTALVIVALLASQGVRPHSARATSARCR